MSVQVFLQGKLVGVQDFVLAPAADGLPAGQALLAGRSHWISLLAEVLPRALLAELGLARILLGSSGGGEFLLVLPSELVEASRAWLDQVNSGLTRLSGGRLRLAAASTENLGDWSIVRRRLAEEMWRQTQTVAAAAGPGFFDPAEAGGRTSADDYFAGYLAPQFRDAQSAGMAPEDPARILLNEGSRSFPLGSGPDAIPLARHTALSEDGSQAAATEELAGRAQGRAVWGVLRGDVDSFGARLRRLSSVEEHIQLSVLFKQFFAGELDLACSVGEFWRKATILYSGGDDFAIFGSWDALLLLAREMQRLFHMFAETNLKDLPGPEGKTITMSMALASAADTPFAAVYEEATRGLAAAKSAGKDCFHVFEKTVEWRHVNHAGDLKEIMLRIVREFGAPGEFLEELSSFYREKPDSRYDRPWRYHRRLALVLGAHKDRELQRLQKALITDIVGKSQSQVRLRPAGRVAVEWARLLMESTNAT